jgi:hypothetical protein
MEQLAVIIILSTTFISGLVVGYLLGWTKRTNEVIFNLKHGSWSCDGITYAVRAQVVHSDVINKEVDKILGIKESHKKEHSISELIEMKNRATHLKDKKRLNKFIRRKLMKEI